MLPLACLTAAAASRHRSPGILPQVALGGRQAGESGLPAILSLPDSRQLPLLEESASPCPPERFFLICMWGGGSVRVSNEQAGVRF